MKMLIDFNLKEEGPTHQINKKWIWYKIKNENGVEFTTELSHFHGGITLKKCNAHMEYKTILNGVKIIPDIAVLDSNGVFVHQDQVLISINAILIQILI